MKHLWLIAIALAACGKDKPKDAPKPEPAKHVEEAPPKPKKVEATAETFGKTPATPFGKVAKLKLGMTEADAKAAAPELFPAKSISDGGVTYKLVIERDRLVRIEIKDDNYNNLEKLVAQAWGPGTMGKGVLGDENPYWFDAANNTRAVADSSDLVLSEYLPIDKLLGGSDTVEIAALAKPVYGITLEELAKNYAGQMKDDKHIVLPPAEWDHDGIDVFVLYSERKKKVDDYNLEIADNGSEPAKDAILAAFKKKWGEPKLKKPYGSDKDTMVFHAKNPLIEVDRNVENKAWSIRVRPKDDACGGPCYKGL